MNYKKYLLCCVLMVIAVLSAIGQKPAFEFAIKKPDQYKERPLPSEKFKDKKFTKVRRFFQNTFTKYNYYFNANLRLNQIVEQSKRTNNDDYTQLLSFYPYSLQTTSKDPFLDSIIWKCTSGILLHDLRNDWIDDLYLIMGKTYLLRQDYDSARMIFSYINYAYGPKGDDGYDKVIGSNQGNNNNPLSVSTPERKKYILKKAPIRNEAFLYQIRAMIEDSLYLDAASLITTLQNDPLFPARLQNSLHEQLAYMHYRQQEWDSAAVHLEQAIDVAENRAEKARWWYLAGQMYQMANMFDKASNAYAQSSELTFDPVMDVYARLNTIRLNKSNNPKIIDENIAKLVSMAKKDKYQNYKNIIYYAAALIELERNGYDAATAFLKNSIKYKTTDENQTNRSFMLLGDVHFQKKDFSNAAFEGYDSTKNAGLTIASEKRLEYRKTPTHDIYLIDEEIKVNDSLLQVALLPEAERDALVKKVVKQQRKLRGLKEENMGIAGSAPLAGGSNTTVTDLFSSGGTSFYFYDANARANGFTKFKQIWGDRPNVDNWRRSAKLKQTNFQNVNLTNNNTNNNDPLTDVFDSSNVSYDNYYSRLPISPEKQNANRLKSIDKLFEKAEIVHYKLEEYSEAIKIYEEVLRRSADTGVNREKSIFGLIHCYDRIGDKAKSDFYKSELLKKHANSELANRFNNGTTQQQAKSKAEVDKTYTNIYNQFLEGNFAKAVEQKNEADKNFNIVSWSPQLSYIESVYYIKERQDSVAIKKLNDLQKAHSTSPLAGKAKTMVDVLKRRAEIEKYLTDLQITRMPEDSIGNIPEVVAIPERKLVSKAEMDKADSTRISEKDLAEKMKAEKQKADSIMKSITDKQVKDSLAKAEKLKLDLEKKLQDSLINAAKADSIRLVVEQKRLDSLAIVKADSIKAAVAKMTTDSLEAARILDSITAVNKAIEAREKAEREAIALANKNRLDSIQNAIKLTQEKRRIDSIENVRKEELAKANAIMKPSATSSPYKFSMNDGGYVAIVLEKIDPAYVNEVFYAFGNYKNGYKGTKINSVKKRLKDNLWLVLLQNPNFQNVQGQLDFIETMKPLAQSEIINWLEPSKYKFIILNQANLDLLSSDPNIEQYLKALNEVLPGKF
ncbi:type IX secretion system periplasmic lipoprotein PorW/SprE [Polluticaenibacter yanchengensis]|uniref:Tetratricopeptide repeat protein n=1 Tax=Polluticaenibacter yanchengensis TaxID=3014562 RepID=A0ABT4UKB5_9BACT|nr:hypothetical protein [Chitinophagaceae bacterium LY-5]